MTAACTADMLTSGAERRVSEPREQDACLFWSHSPDMQAIARVIDKVADSDVTVLVRGESGVGKELVAQALHQQSPRWDRPFVKVNCAALPADLLESELFGHERGAFTGAVRTRIGKFEQADSGTLFLDEIGELTAALQAKLLHVVQDAQFTRLGSNTTINVDVRLVAATNRDLEGMMHRGEFREDLFYRLNVIEVVVPSLRARRGEISHLCQFFMHRYARQYNRPCREISSELQLLLQQYDWPGNVRELENMIKRIVILQDEQVVLRDMRQRKHSPRLHPTAPVAEPAPSNTAPIGTPCETTTGGMAPPSISPPAPPRLADVARTAAATAERQLIADTLNRTHWNRKRAAEQLDCSYKTLLNRIKECGDQQSARTLGLTRATA